MRWINRRGGRGWRNLINPGGQLVQSNVAKVTSSRSLEWHLGHSGNLLIHSAHPFKFIGLIIDKKIFAKSTVEPRIFKHDILSVETQKCFRTNE